MKRLFKGVGLTAMGLLFAASASAVPINLQLNSITTVGGSFPTDTTYTPGLPILGSGDIDFGAGTGTLTLSDYSSVLDVQQDLILDAQIDVTGWMQTITSIDGSGNITSTGSGAVGLYRSRGHRRLRLSECSDDRRRLGSRGWPCSAEFSCH